MIQADGDTAAACERLRKAKQPFGVFLRYSEADRETVLNGSWLESVLPAHPLFAFLLPGSGCAPGTREAVYAYIRSVRDSQRHPVIPMDILRDGLKIDEIISTDGCLVGFGADGVLYTHTEIHREADYNLFQNRLEDILRRVQVLR